MMPSVIESRLTSFRFNPRDKVIFSSARDYLTCITTKGIWMASAAEDKNRGKCEGSHRLGVEKVKAYSSLQTEV